MPRRAIVVLLAAPRAVTARDEICHPLVAAAALALNALGLLLLCPLTEISLVLWIFLLDPALSTAKFLGFLLIFPHRPMYCWMTENMRKTILMMSRRLTL